MGDLSCPSLFCYVQVWYWLWPLFLEPWLCMCRNNYLCLYADFKLSSHFSCYKKTTIHWSCAASPCMYASGEKERTRRHASK